MPRNVLLNYLPCICEEYRSRSMHIMPNNAAGPVNEIIGPVLRVLHRCLSQQAWPQPTEHCFEGKSL